MQAVVQEQILERCACSVPFLVHKWSTYYLKLPTFLHWFEILFTSQAPLMSVGQWNALKSVIIFVYTLLFVKLYATH